MKPIAFRYHPLASPLHSAEELARFLGPYANALQSAGGTPAAPHDALSSPLVAFIQTGGTERLALDLLARAPAGAPFFLFAHPAHNSLPAALEILARCRQLRRHARLFFLRKPDDSDTLAAFDDAFRAASAADAIRNARIGCFGAPSDWLVASSQTPDIVARRFGAHIIPISLDILRAAIRDTPMPTPDDPAFELYRDATATPDVLPETFAASLRLARALHTLARERNLTALTIRCFDILADGATGCLALAMLSDASIPAACEGDIPSTLGMLWAWLLAGRPAWMANPADIDPSTDTALLAHCTTPLTLASSYAFLTHFESGSGLAIDATLPTPSPATLIRIGGADLDTFQAADVTLLESLHRPGLCRTQVRIGLPPGAAARWLAAPLGNHVILALTHFASLFRLSFSFTLPP